MPSLRSFQERRATRAALLFLAASVLPTLFSYALSLNRSRHAGIPALDGLPWGDAAARFTDVINYRVRFQHLHSASFFAHDGYFWAWYPFVYPMLAAVFCSAVFAFGSHALTMFIASTVGVFLAVGAAFGSSISPRFHSRWSAYLIIGATLITSYPALFLILRGNIEAYGFAFVAGAIWCYYTSRYSACAVLIGFAAAFKLYPIILIGLLLSDKRHREAVLAAGSFVFIELASCLFVGPSLHVVLAGMADGLSFFKSTFALTMLGYQHDHSLFSVWKMVGTVVFSLMKRADHTAGHPWIFQPLLLNLYLVTAAAGGLAIYFFRLRFMPRTNKIAAIVCLSILLPPVSFTYTLVHLFCVWAVLLVYFLKEHPEHRANISLQSVMVLLGVASANLEFANFGRMLGGEIQCVCLVSIVVISLVVPWPERQAEIG